MTDIERKITEVFNRFCDLNGGGAREIIITPSRFGGFDATLVWDGFIAFGGGSRQDGLIDLLIKSIGNNVFHIVRTVHLITFAEKVEEEAIAGAIPDDPSWLRP